MRLAVAKRDAPWGSPFKTPSNDWAKIGAQASELAFAGSNPAGQSK